MKFNMNKYLVLLLAMCILLLPSCGKSSQDAGNYGQDSNNGNADAADSRQGGWGNNPDLFGEVKTISGDKVTINLIEMPQNRQMTDEERQQMRERRPNGTFAPDSTRFPRNTRVPNSTRPPDSTRPPMGGFTQERNYTGETVTLTISSDIPITTFERGNGGSGENGGNGDNAGNPGAQGNQGNGGNRGFGNFQEKQLSLADIKVGSLLQVWYKQDNGDKKEIQNIRVMQAQNGSNAQQN